VRVQALQHAETAAGLDAIGSLSADGGAGERSRPGIGDPLVHHDGGEVAGEGRLPEK